MIAVGTDGPRVQTGRAMEVGKGLLAVTPAEAGVWGKGNGCIPVPYHVQGKLSRE